MKIVKDGKYKRTRIWGICLICFGIAAVYFTNEYRHRYSFECDTFWVDKQKGIYHLDFDNDCSIAEDATSLTKMKGFEIETTNIGFAQNVKSGLKMLKVIIMSTSFIDGSDIGHVPQGHRCWYM